MTRGSQFLLGLMTALLLTATISASLFFESHAGTAFDNAFWPILAVAAGTGVLLLALRELASSRPVCFAVLWHHWFYR